MKLSDGFKVWIPSALTFTFYTASFVALTVATKNIPISTAYAIWSGLGTTLTALIGTAYFGDTMNLVKFVSLALVILGAIGLNLSGGAAH